MPCWGQSGWLTRLSPQAQAQVAGGIAVYKQRIRQHIPECVPFYPLGMADMTTLRAAAALGMRSPRKQFLAVWRREASEEVHIPGRFEDFRLLYPTDLGIRVKATGGGLTVMFPETYMGCILST